MDDQQHLALTRSIPLNILGSLFLGFFVLEKLRKAMSAKAQSCSNIALRFANQNGKKHNLTPNKIYGAKVLIYLICGACSSIALFAAVQSKFLKVKLNISHCILNSFLGLETNLIQLRQICCMKFWFKVVQIESALTSLIWGNKFPSSGIKK